jgi:hypothetical protein
VKKELRPVHDHLTCDVCGRTILKGERTEAYLAPGGHRRLVCDLCAGRAQNAGWIRESVAAEMPARVPRDEPRRSLFGRLRRGRGDAPQQAAPQPEGPTYAEHEAMYGAGDGSEPAEWDEQLETPAAEHTAPPPPAPRPRSRPKDPRHVRAVPSTDAGRIERAFELFNGTRHQRTTAGLARSLGVPWVTAAPDADQPSTVTVLVAWELSWYRYRVDLGDEQDPVALLDKGDELDQIDSELREWNGTLDAEGRLVVSESVNGGGTEP